MKIKKILIIIGICLASIGLLSCSVLLFDNNNSNNSSGSSSSDEEIYTVTYDGNGATSLPVAYTRFKDYNKVNLVTPAKTGYIFDGWYEGDTKVEKLTENRDYNLTAKFNIVNYSISYELNGGYLPGLYNSVDDLIYEIVDSAVATNETLDTIEEKYYIIRNNTAQFYGNDDRLMSFYFNSKEKYNFLIEYFKDNSIYKSNINWDNLENANDFEEFFELDGDNIAYFCSEFYNFVLSKWSCYSEFSDGFPYCTYYGLDDYDYKEVRGSYYDENLLNKLYDYMPKTTYKITSDDIWLTNCVPIKEGYVFDGWYTSPSFINQIGVIVAGHHEDITLYAKWNKIYTITFDSTGGTQCPSFTLLPGQSFEFVPVELYTPTRDGYEFNGWYDLDGNIVNSTINYDDLSEDITLSAKWSRIQATYELYDEDDSSNDYFILGNEVYVYIPFSDENDGEFYEQISFTTDLGNAIDPLYIHYIMVNDNLETGYYICAGDKSKDSIISAKGESIANLYDEYDEICGYIYKFIIDNEDIVNSQYVIYPITEDYEYAYKGFRFVYNVQLPNEE